MSQATLFNSSDAPPATAVVTDLTRVLADLTRHARADGSASTTLTRGLRVTVYHRDTQLGLTLTRPEGDAPPGEDEAHICARHAGWSAYTVEAFRTRDDRPGWHVRLTNSAGEASDEDSGKLDSTERARMIDALVHANSLYSDHLRDLRRAYLASAKDSEIRAQHQALERLRTCCVFPNVKE